MLGLLKAISLDDHLKKLPRGQGACNMDQTPVTDEISSDFTLRAQEPFLNNTNVHWISSLSLPPEEHNCGNQGVETLHCHGDSEDVLTEDDHLALSNDGLSDLSNSDISLSEVCVASNIKHFEEEMNYEIQQAYRIFREFLTEKHKVITSPFLHPLGNQETPYGVGGICSRSQANVKQAICICRIEEKFINKEYDTITKFVADFRLMLENCYRYHGVDHWLSKQAQKLEIMLEQKLTLLSRKLREKTSLAVTSKGRFAVGEECISTSSSRRRQTSRSLNTLTVGGHESIMVQTLRLEEQQKAKEEKRQRELEKKEAEEMSAKETDEWENNLLSLASPHNVETLWELPAIGHFLCLAQTALNLPEIVFFELERCLLMPRCSSLLSKIMSSLLSSPQRRSTLHRRPVMPYRRWESELRQWVKVWYQSVGTSHDQAAKAQQLGLCHQFFSVLGEISPLEAKAFHLLPFYQRVWLLKGLCDHVYETQRDIQDAVLAQPIHECRESILGYDSKENAYIHFPHFCGADLRIYCQSPCKPPTTPFTSVLVKKVEIFPKLEEDIVTETSEVSGTSFGDKLLKGEMCIKSKIESNDGDEVIGRCRSCRPREQNPLKSNIHIHRDETKPEIEPGNNTDQIIAPFRKRILITQMEEKTTERKLKRLKKDNETDNSFCLKNETVIQDCLSIGEHCYTGKSPAGSVTASAFQNICITTQSTTQDGQKSSGSDELKQYQCCCGALELSTQEPSEYTPKLLSSFEERVKDKILTTKEQREKKGKKLLSRLKHEHNRLSRKPIQPEASKPSVQNRSITIKRKNEKKQQVQDKPLNHLKEEKAQTGPPFKLVCTNLDDLRALINKTEDELDDLESTKKRLNRWYNRRGAVKDLHSTLIRLLNELTPWEPKLIKAYQRNRLRLKKEFEVFKNHPEYSNFVCEEDVSSSDDGDLEFLLDQFRQSAHDDPEHILPRGLGGTVNELSTEQTTERPVIHISYDHHKRSLSAACDRVPDRSDTLRNTCEFEPSHNSVKPSHSNSSLTPSMQLRTIPLSKSNSLHATSGKLKNYTPIPTLLAKNVGNKVTLMKQPAYLLETDKLNVESKRTTTTENTIQLKVNGCSSGPSQNSHQRLKQNSPVQPVMDSIALPPVLSISKTAEFLKESTQVFYTDHKPQNPVNSSSTNPRSEEVRPQQVVILPSNIILNKTNETIFAQQSSGIYPIKQSDDSLKSNTKMDTILCMSANLSGVLIPENKILVQQVPPSKNVDLTDSRSSFSDILNSKSQPSAINVARSNGTQYCGLQTSPKYSVITSTPSGIFMSTDSKQELKTVCIRESQAILVTTRGGNTGIVKVQKSSDHPACLTKSPVITIAPQFQAYPVPKTTPLFSSDAAGQSDATSAVTPGSVQTQSHIQSLKSKTKVTTCAKTTSISFSQEMSPSLSPTKCQAFTGLSGYISTSLSKPVTPESCPPALVKKNIVIKPCPDKTSEDNRSQREKLILISTSSHDVNVRGSKTLPTSVTLASPPKVKASLPIQGSIAALKQATFTRPTQEVMKSLSTHPVSLIKDKADFVFSETSTDTSSQIPCLIATTIAQNTAVQPQSSKCRDAEKMTSITAQPANSTVISRGITASSLKGFKHLSISSMSKVSQLGNITCPSTNPVSATSFKKNHGLSTMLSSNSNIYPVTSQSISNPVSTLNTQSKHLNSLLISNASGSFDKTSLSPSLISKPQVSFSVPNSSEITEGHKDLSAQTTTNSSISATGTVQQQIVINTSMPLPGGTHIVLNNAKFMVPPKGLDPGSHIFVISGNLPQQLSATSAKEAAVAFQEVNQAPVLQSATRQPCVPAIKSFGVCTLAVAPLLQTTRSTVTATKLTAPNNKSHINKTKTVEKCPFLQSANIESTTEGASRGLLSTQVQSQHPTISIESISCSSSTALMHMGHSSLLVQKRDPTAGLKFL